MSEAFLRFVKTFSDFSRLFLTFLDFPPPFSQNFPQKIPKSGNFSQNSEIKCNFPTAAAGRRPYWTGCRAAVKSMEGGSTLPTSSVGCRPTVPALLDWTPSCCGNGRLSEAWGRAGPLGATEARRDPGQIESRHGLTRSIWGLGLNFTEVPGHPAFPGQTSMVP